MYIFIRLFIFFYCLLQLGIQILMGTMAPKTNHLRRSELRHIIDLIEAVSNEDLTEGALFVMTVADLVTTVRFAISTNMVQNGIAAVAADAAEATVQMARIANMHVTIANLRAEIAAGEAKGKGKGKKKRASSRSSSGDSSSGPSSGPGDGGGGSSGPSGSGGPGDCGGGKRQCIAA